MIKNRLKSIACIYSSLFLIYLIIVSVITNKAGDVYSFTDVKCNLLYFLLHIVYFLFIYFVDSKFLNCITLLLVFPQLIACGDFGRYVLVSIVELVILIKRKRGFLPVCALAFCVAGAITFSFYGIILSGGKDYVGDAGFDAMYRSPDGVYEIAVDDTYIHGEEAKNFILRSNKTIDLGIKKLKYRDQVIYTSEGDSVPELVWGDTYVLIGDYKYSFAY